MAGWMDGRRVCNSVHNQLDSIQIAKKRSSVYSDRHLSLAIVHRFELEFLVLQMRMCSEGARFKIFACSLYLVNCRHNFVAQKQHREHIPVQIVPLWSLIQFWRSALLFFFASLQTHRHVIKKKCACSLHRAHICQQWPSHEQQLPDDYGISSLSLFRLNRCLPLHSSLSLSPSLHLSLLLVKACISHQYATRMQTGRQVDTHTHTNCTWWCHSTSTSNLREYIRQ